MIETQQRQQTKAVFAVAYLQKRGDPYYARIYSQTQLVKHANKIHAYDQESSVLLAWDRGGRIGRRETAQVLGSTSKYTKVNEINIACANVSLTVVQGCPCSKLEKEKHRQIDNLVKSHNKSLERNATD